MSNTAMFFSLLTTMVGGIISIVTLIWMAYRRNDDRTIALGVEVTSKLDALSKGQTRLEIQIKGLEDGQARLENRMTQLETRMTQLENRMTQTENGQALLHNEWTKADIRLGNLESAMGALEGKMNTFNNQMTKCLATTARTEGLVRGYFLKDDPRLLDPEYQPEAPDS